MLDQHSNFENLIVGVIFTVALVVFAVMLAASFALLRSEGAIRSNGLSRDAWRNTWKSGLRVISQRFPQGIKTLNWVLCFVIASYVAWWNYSRELSSLNGTSLYPYLIALALLSPACLGVAWLRLTGLTWRRALSLLLWVPVAFGAILLLSRLTDALLFYLGFGS